MNAPLVDSRIDSVLSASKRVWRAAMVAVAGIFVREFRHIFIAIVIKNQYDFGEFVVCTPRMRK